MRKEKFGVRDSGIELANVGARLVMFGRGSFSATRPIRKDGPEIGKNDVCPCGALRDNGLPKKFKDCCGKDQR